MKPEVEKILLIDECEKEYKKKFLSSDSDKKFDDESLISLLTTELKNNYQTYVDYFNNNSSADLKKYTKNVDLSISTRTEGNKMVSLKVHDSNIHEEIWKLYSKSIALAPINSEELAQGYGNRSYILLHFNKFEESIKDIDRAMAITNSDALKVKLLCRKLTSLTALGHHEQKKNTWNLVKSIFDNMDENLKNKHLDTLLKNSENELSINKTNQTIKTDKTPLLFQTDAVNIICDENGTHLTAARDLRPGEMVMVLKPFVTAANSNKFYAYCSHCLAFTWASIPCDHCCLNMFCSEKCKIEAWEKYHEIECKVLPHMQFDLALYYHYQVSMRAIFMGVKELGTIGNLAEKLKQIDISTKDLKNEDIVKNSITSFYTMQYEYNLRYFVQFLKNSILLLTLIIQATDFFEENLKLKTATELSEDKDVMFISFLLLKFSVIASNNMDHVSLGNEECKKKRSCIDCTGLRCCPRGAYVTPVFGMVDNDCNASASKFFTDDGKVAYLCCQPIEKNSQIYVNNFNFFYREEKKVRQKMMKFKNYTCECKACKQNWPSMKILFERFSSDLVDKKSLQATLSQEIMPRYKNITEYRTGNCIPDEETYEQISKDVTEAVNACGQPTFLSCVLIDVLITMFECRHGISIYPVPKTC